MSPTVTAGTVTAPAPVNDTYQLMPIGWLVSSPTNPRKHFDDEKLKELSASILEKGVIAPIVTRRIGSLGMDTFEIVDGERRFRASQSAGLTHVPVIIRDLSDADVLEIQLVANIQRDDLQPLEEAKGYKALLASNPAKYSAAFIADRIGRSEQFVWDRIKLLDLIPEVQELLERDVILVGHAELLAKLKPEQQKAAIKLPQTGYGNGGAGGVFESRGPVLDLEGPEAKKDKYRHVKHRTVRELEYWIARHVRFDPAHMAAAAPLEFGGVIDLVSEAKARPGRGRKVISITYDHQVHPDARDESERTYGRQSWKKVGARPCDKSVLGIVVTGQDRGQAFEVCVHKECDVHWGKEKREREKARAAAAKGTGTKKARSEAETWQQQQERRAEEQTRADGAYAKLYPIVAEAIRVALPMTLDRTVFEYLFRGKPPADAHPGNYVELLVMQDVDGLIRGSWNKEELLRIAKHFGVDVKPLEKQAKAAEPQAASAPATKAKAAKKAKKKAAL